MFATDQAIRPDRLARELEDRGFESLFLPEHTHIPTSRLTPYQAAEDAGRDPESIGVMVFGALADAARLDHFRRIGVTRTVFGLPSATADVVLPLLDRWADLL